uniref:Uncharacterized protein n=1 Tax=Anopheles dirus TaxID=7168 RepID=A0A182NRF5_9DIPT
MQPEECFTPVVVDENTMVCSTFSRELQLGFQKLYEEIDFLSEQATRSAQLLITGEGNDSTHLMKADVDDLLVYAKKFIRETRKTIISFDEHGVQVEPQKKCNKKVSTPRAWVNSETGEEREEIREPPTEPRSAIKITQIVPVGIPGKIPQQPQVNNEVAVATMPEVRNVGTNVNFIAQRTIAKKTNVRGYVVPLSYIDPRQLQHPKGQANHGVSEKNVNASGGLPQQSDNNGSEGLTSNNIENNAGDSMIVNDADVHVKKPDNSDKFETEISDALTPYDKPDGAVDPSLEAHGFTSHVLPSVSIQGRWDANLKVQQTGTITILDEKDIDNASNDNVMYVELKQGHQKKMNTNISEQSQPIVDAKKEDVKAKTIALDCSGVGSLDSSKWCIEKLPSKRPSQVDSDETEPEDTHLRESDTCEQTLVRIPSSVCKAASKLRRNGSKPNKYLDPFVDVNLLKTAPKKSTEMMLEIFDDESSSSSSEASLEETDIRVLLNLSDDVTNNAPIACRKEPDMKVPKSVRIPALRSPSKSLSRVNSSSESEDGINSNGQTSRRFLENLRIWGTAVEAQSQNMKMGNELTENLNLIRNNLKKITLESTKLAKMAQNAKESTTKEEVYEIHSAQDGTTGLSYDTTPQLSARPKSCECFGCQSTFEQPVRRPATSPPHEHKKFQRTVLESNPRYARTIRKICNLGSTARPASVGADRDERIKQAAAKFLQSLHGNAKHRSNCSSTSSSGIFQSPSKSISNVSNVLDGVECPSLITSRNEFISDSELNVDSENENYVCGAESSDGTDMSSYTSNVPTYSDVGEVLSPGEFK